MDLKSASREPHRDVFVLSGGANRGAVQVGMMEVLLEHGIVPDALVGTSVGALNAAFMGLRPDRARVRELRARWMRLSTRDIFPGGTLSRMGHLLRQRPYLFSPAALTRLVADWLPAENLEDLPTPVRVVTTPLTGDSAAYHRHGNLAQLLLASAAVPAVFPPVELPASCGHPGLHVDGGIADLVPISGAADFAPTRVFVLDASVPSRLPRGRTPIDVLVASLGVATRVRPEPDLGPGVAVHRLRTPDLDIRMTDFSSTARHIADGRVAAEQLIDQLIAQREQELASRGSEETEVLAPVPARRSTIRLWDRRNRAS
ncbi:patatin-like phospholipase family protein [Marmoricola sp. URHB0036]|jgi:NTE family protein|uniref:patatin-like phospholipase family protein n=1 Tax=Marmoricola sp. URHB0036 TaxID=1298863 RepID=UPI00041808A7|nr:patatin-like phospholipase family protein [Marmoricola sp. URHB0036]